MASKNKSNNKKDTNHVPIRVYISVIGLALFTFFTFFGFFLKDGDMAMSGLYALGFTIAISVTLWVMTYAKRREDNDLRKWKVVEFAILGVYIVLAILFAKPTLRFFAVNADKENMKAIANNDISGYYTLLDTFHNDQSNALETHVTGMYNTIGNRNSQSDEVKNYLSEKEITSRSSITGYQEAAQEDIDDEGFRFRTELDKCKASIDSWKLLEIPIAVRKLKKYQDIVPEKLGDFSRNNPFPRFDRRSDGKYYLGNTTEFSYTAPELAFPDMVKSATNITPVAAIIFILLHAIILFGYYMAYRSKRTIIGKTIIDDGGVILKFESIV